MEPVLPTKPVGIGWVENPVALPLGIDRRTLRRSVFLDDIGEPFGEQLKFIKKIRQISFRDATDRLKKSAPGGRRGPCPPLGTSGDVDRVLQGCMVLREIAQKAGRGRILSHEEKMVLFYTVGLADRDDDSLHQLLEGCPDYHFEKVARQAARLKPNPVSCPKVRELVPELTASVTCSCSFDLRGGKYPSPLLHVNPHLVPAAEDMAEAASLEVREAARRFIHLKHHYDEVSKALMRLESTLERHFDRKRIDRIEVGGWVLRRHSESGETRWRVGRD